jgi:RNA polymerase sigma factor (sigma-70 family)
LFQLAEGKEGAMELKVMLREIEACKRVALVYGVPPADLPDLAQTARIALWRAAERGGDLDTQAKVRAWFAEVGRRLAVNWHRLRRRLPSLLDPDELAEVAGVAPGGEGLAVARTPRALLDDALDELAATRPELYAVVEAHDLHERSMHDVAADLGLLVNTAWNRRRRGWDFLRAHVARAQALQDGRRR